MSYIRDRYRKQFYGKKQLRRGAAALVAAGLFAASFGAGVAYAATTNITDVDGVSLIDSSKSVHDLYAHEVKDDIAVSRYNNFTLAEKEIANMYFHKQAGGIEGKHLVNLVDAKIDIDGTVNAIKGNRVGGEIFFLSPNGIAIGKSGVINAGAVDLIVPTGGEFNRLWGKFRGSEWKEHFAVDALQGIKEFDNGSDGQDSSDDPGIKVEGAINARSGILLGATNIDIATGAALTSNRAKDFTGLVNVTDGNGSTVTDAGLSGVGLKATTDDASGDIILTAHAEHLADDNNLDNAVTNTAAEGWVLNKKTNMAATINVDGKIEGDGAVKLDATANTLFTEGDMLNVLTQTGLLEDILGGVGVDIAADWVDKTGKASVTVGTDGSVTSGAGLTLNARSDLKIQLSTVTPAVKTGNVTGSFLPTTALDVVLFDNDATIDVAGTLASTANVTGLDNAAAAERMTKLTATATSTAVTVARAATKTKPVGGVDPDLVYAAVLVEKGDTNATVNLSNPDKPINIMNDTAMADFAAAATTVDALDSTVAAAAPSSSLASAAMGYIDYDSNASVNIDKPIAARSVTIQSDNHLMRDSLTVSSSISDPDPTVKNPFVISGKTGMVDTLLLPLVNKVQKFAKIDVAGGKMSSWRTAGAEDDSAGAILSKVIGGDYFKAGASIAATDQHNTSSVRFGKGAAITAGGPVALTAKTHADYDGFDYSDYLKFSSVGELNTQKTSKTAKVMVAGAIVADSVENDAVITFESGDGKAASVKSTQGAIAVNANANMAYIPMESGIKFVLGKLKDFGTAMNNAGLGYVDTLEEIGQDISNIDNYDEITFIEVVNNLLYNVENTFDDVVNNLDDTTDAYKAVKVAYNALISCLDPATFTNYYARTQAKSNADQGSALDITGAVNVDILKNRATVLADQNVTFDAPKGSVSLGAATKTSTVSLSGNGGKYFTTNQTQGSGLGATVAVQDISASSLLMLGKGVSVNAGNDVNLTADNMMVQTDIIYGAGESKGAAAVNGMIGVVTGASNSVVSVDDEAKITAANNAAVTADMSCA